ncbi:MAG: hypothetical protein ABIO46_02350 [Chitinophagales bacterium]
MKSSSRSLFQLIHALSKEERSYVLRTAIHYRKSGKNILVQLFKAMEQWKPEEYDEKELGKRIPNLSVRKNELFETILRSLADREDRNLAVVMLGKLRWAAILHYKKLFPEAISLLNEVEDWAKSENQLYIQGVILQYKTFFANSSLYKSLDINFETIGESMVSNARNILHITEIYQQYLEVSKITRQSFLLRTEKDCKKVKVLIQSSTYNGDLTALPVSSQCFFHLSGSYLYKLKCSYDKAYDNAAQSWELMHQSTLDFPLRRPQEYLICFTAYVAACLDAKKTEQSKKWIGAYKHWIDEKYPGNLIVNGKFYCLYLAHHYLENGGVINPSILNEVKDFFLENKHTLDEDVRRGLNYLLMIAFFGLGEFSVAWDYSQLILNGNAMGPRKELFDATRLVFLLVLFESNKFAELEYYCMQLYGFARKKPKKEYELEKTMVKHFKRIAADANSSANHSLTLKKLSNDLQQLSEGDNLCAKQLLHQFDFMKWVQQKIEGELKEV